MKNRIVKWLAVSLASAMVFVGVGNKIFAKPTISGGKTVAKKRAVHPKTVRVTVNKNGFSPSTINVEKGAPLTLIFRRPSREGCGDKVVFPSLSINRNLPVGKPVTIKITPTKTGEITFTCGMGMYKGTIVATEGH